jgi:CRP/FNR family transcriptional regulator
MPLSSTYLFKDLSEVHLQKIDDTASEHEVQKGQVLFEEGSPAGQLFVLKSGAIEMLTTVDDAFELPVSIIRSPGRCIGTSSLVPPYQYSLSARCVEDAALAVIQQKDLKQLIQEDQALGHTIMANLAQHLLDRLKETRRELKIHFKTLFRSMHS